MIDTGIDASHADLIDRVDVTRSRDFTADLPATQDGCSRPFVAPCTDPVDIDENGHGTHVAGIIAASINGFGIAGVAPGITLVNLRAGDDSGLFLLRPVVDALTYAGDIGINIVNMSFYVDPWLYNCEGNPGDDPAAQAEQRMAIMAVQRAVDYARAKGVTVIAALGNGHADLDRSLVDSSSPDLPAGAMRPRRVDSSCPSLPSGIGGVIGVSALGPSMRVADYSNYGMTQNDLSAPGGWFADSLSVSGEDDVRNGVVSTWPATIARREIAAHNGTLPANLRRQCSLGSCGYFKYLEGTSMAAPHVAGVAALIVSRFGTADDQGRGATLAPALVEERLRSTAQRRECPRGGQESLSLVSPERSSRGPCVGAEQRNSYFGYGIVDAATVFSLGSNRQRARYVPSGLWAGLRNGAA